MDYDSLLKLVKQRRSIRQFKPDPIPDEFIDKIIEVARWAPSGFNTQPWEFVVVRNKDLKDKIVGVIDGYKSAQFDRMESTREEWQGTDWKPRPKGPTDFRGAPIFIALFGDPRIKLALPMAAYYATNKRESIFNSSLANAYLYMHLAATSLGLASQWITAIQYPYVNCLVKEILGIPRELESYDIMAVGYPAATPLPKFMRDKTDMVHYDYCGKDAFRNDEEIKDFIKLLRNWSKGAYTGKRIEG
jgi:nitroreductase